MSLISALGTVLRASFLLALALAILPVLRGASASLRRFVLLLGLGASLLVPVLSVPFPGRPVVALPAPTFAGHVVAEALSTNVAPKARPRAPQRDAPVTAFTLTTSEWLSLAWAAGALFVVARQLRFALFARRLRAKATLAQPGVSISSSVESPVVVGLFRPIVILPPAARGWSEERMQAVLLHESSHVRHFDGLALLVAQLACALYWFQPLAWLARSRLRRECELTADEAVIAAGIRPTSYAQHLLEIARGLVPKGGIAMAARPSELARRIQVLVTRDRLPARFTPIRAVLLGTAALVVLGGVACMNTAPTPAVPASAASSVAASLTKSTDAGLQSIAEDEARRAHAEWGAARVAIIVLDPHTGAVLANADDAPGQPIVPASTLKPLTVATALDAELITPQQRFDCGNGRRNYGSLVLRDAGEYGSLDAAEILAVSSNIGVSRIFDILGGERLGEGFRRFRVDAPREIPSGTMRGAIIAMGEGSTTTPVALAAAYGVFANDGLLTTSGAPSERVLKPSTAQTVRAMLEGAVSGERATGKAAAVAGTRVGGKTGTSDDEDCASCAQGAGPLMSFVGIVPIDTPRWVIYVGVGKPNKAGSGGTIAAPIFSRVATRALAR